MQTDSDYLKRITKYYFKNRTPSSIQIESYDNLVHTILPSISRTRRSLSRSIGFKNLSLNFRVCISENRSSTMRIGTINR